MNRSQRRAEVRLHRGRAKWIARTKGCTCPCELRLDPTSGRPVWTERPDSDRRLYMTKHRPSCPIWDTCSDNPDWVVVIPLEPECPR